MKSLPSKFKELIELRPRKEVLDELKNKYEILINFTSSYECEVKEEMKLREIDKLETFKKSSLNIKLPKFVGYNSPMNIYTFISEFDKLYSGSVPKLLQADLLKNNLLDKRALSLVKSVTNIEEIWSRLKSAFGDREILLANKLSEINSFDLKQKDSVKIVEFLSKVTNIMRDLMQLAATHSIENELYYGDAFSRIYNLLGESRMMRWLTLNCETPKEGKWKWKQLIEFLENDLKIHQQRAAIQTHASKRPDATNKRYDANRPPVNRRLAFPAYENQDEVIYNEGSQHSNISSKCNICGSNDHIQTNGPRGIKLVQYFSCKKFVNMSPNERFQYLKTNGLCFQCLFPGARSDQGKHKEGRCQHDFICQHPSHNNYTSKKHVLVCDEHKNEQQNKDILEHYKSRCITRQPVSSFSKNIQISSSFHNSMKCNMDYQSKATAEEVNQHNNAIYMLQSILIDDHSYTIFYDSGCSDFISRHQAVQQLGSRTTQRFDGKIKMGGIGGVTSESAHGIYSVSIPLRNGGDAVITGVCMDKITQTFPYYPLNGEVIKDIRNAYMSQGSNLDKLPSVPAQVGGDIDFMIGIKYLRHFPEAIFQLPSGLTIYESRFFNTDGSCGVNGGPHKVFSDIEKQYQSTNFIQSQYKLYQQGYHVNPDVRMLGYVISPTDVFTSTKDENEATIDTFNITEYTGSEILYR